MIFKEVSRLNIEISHNSFPLINSVLSGVQDGKIFFDERTYFVIHKAGFSYLAIQEGTEYQHVLDFFIQSKKLPEYFHIYDATTNLIEVINENTEKITAKVRERMQLRLSEGILNFNDFVHSGYKLNRIDRDNFEKLSAFNLSLESKFWKSKDDFLNNGFGFAVEDNLGLPISLCYSACISNGIAEIDVATLSDYRRKGFGKIAVAQFVRHCLDNGLIANWDCFVDNIGSLKTAKHIGFRAVKTYKFLSIFNKTRKT